MKLIILVSLLVLGSLVSSAAVDFNSMFKKDVNKFVADLQTGFQTNKDNFVKELKAYYETFPTFNKGDIVDGSVKADDLIPTQNEINLKNSLKFISDNPDNVNKYLNCGTEPVTVKENLLVAKIKDVYYILDGHHRWSQVYLVNKECQIKAYIVSGFNTIRDALKIAHLAVATSLPSTKTEYPVSVVPPEDKIYNILDVSKDCKKTVNDWLVQTYIPSCLDQYKRKDNTLDNTKLFEQLTVVLNRMREKNIPNIGLLAPERQFMPQADQSEGGLSTTVKALRLVTLAKNKKNRKLK